MSIFVLVSLLASQPNANIVFHQLSEVAPNEPVEDINVVDTFELESLVQDDSVPIEHTSEALPIREDAPPIETNSPLSQDAIKFNENPSSFTIPLQVHIVHYEYTVEEQELFTEDISMDSTVIAATIAVSMLIAVAGTIVYVRRSARPYLPAVSQKKNLGNDGDFLIFLSNTDGIEL